MTTANRQPPPDDGHRTTDIGGTTDDGRRTSDTRTNHQPPTTNHQPPTPSLFIGLPGPDLTDADRALLAATRPGGVILFARNVRDLASTRSLVADLKALDPQLLVCIDQEGGPVDRLRPHVPSLPSGLALGLTDDRELAHRAGALTGEILASLGIDWDLAPVCDLQRSNGDNGIGLRSFGASTERAIQCGAGFVAGLEEAGVMSCVKHFPGLGATVVDSHRALPVLDPLDARHLERELDVFQSVLPHAASALVSHAVYPHTDRRPASLSPAVLTGMLRDELGFDGVAVTDDLVMGALGGRDIGAAAVEALIAGADALLVCEGEPAIRRCHEALHQALVANQIRRERWDQAAARLDGLRRRRDTHRRIPRPEPAILADMDALARTVAADRAAAHVVRQRLEAPGPVLVLRPLVKWLSDECQRPAGSPFAAALSARAIACREVTYTSETLAKELDRLLADGPRPATVLLATYNAHSYPGLDFVMTNLDHRGRWFHLPCGWPDEFDQIHACIRVPSFGCGWHAVHQAVLAMCDGVDRNARA